MKEVLTLMGATCELHVQKATMKNSNHHAWWEGEATLILNSKEVLPFEFKTANRKLETIHQLRPELARLNLPDYDVATTATLDDQESIDRFCNQLAERIAELKKKGQLFTICVGPLPYETEEAAAHEEEVVSKLQLKLPRIYELA